MYLESKGYKNEKTKYMREKRSNIETRRHDEKVLIRYTETASSVYEHEPSLKYKKEINTDKSQTRIIYLLSRI